MPDITMCDNKKCVLRDMCYRYRAIPDRYQPYAMFEPELTLSDEHNSKNSNWKCDSFWDCRNKGYKLRDTNQVDKQKPIFDDVIVQEQTK